MQFQHCGTLGQIYARAGCKEIEFKGLVINYGEGGGLQKGRGGRQGKFYPYEKVGLNKF